MIHFKLLVRKLKYNEIIGLIKKNPDYFTSNSLNFSLKNKWLVSLISLILITFKEIYSVPYTKTP